MIILLFQVQMLQKLFKFIAAPSNWGKDNNTNDRQVIVESSIIYTNLGNAVLIGEKEATPTAIHLLKGQDKRMEI